MPNPNYRAGRKREYQAIDILKKAGFKTQRGAGSKGIADILALNENFLKIISIKPHQHRSKGLNELSRLEVNRDVIVRKELWIYKKGIKGFEMERVN